jgi:hypothetical protein
MAQELLRTGVANTSIDPIPAQAEFAESATVH